MSKTILWLYDLTAVQLEEAKVILRTLLRPAAHDTAILHTTKLSSGASQYDLCLELSQDAGFGADLVAVLAKAVPTPFECTEIGDLGSIWRFAPELGLHHVQTDALGSAVLSEPQLQGAIVSAAGNGVLLAASLRRLLGTHLDDALEAHRLRTGGANTRQINLAS